MRMLINNKVVRSRGGVIKDGVVTKMAGIDANCKQILCALVFRCQTKSF